MAVKYLIHMTKGLSGTAVEAARQASNLSSSKVTVIDSDFTDQGLSFRHSSSKIGTSGSGVPEILAEIERVKQNTKLYIGISTLDNLVKGGRISRTTGLSLSNIFNMKVVMDFENTELIPCSGRGVKNV